ncbi:EamA family transporter [Sporomusa malonica]|uniref:O-acetylserine/cysteine efflux transporter n=1 Tax=Sporomusa malonica TaxID=112901 RepID=A0A1W2E0P1_9FIRM|nr:EamA family transporter [Sporomusa malonica]SMD03303.1 O-acetylserine/cysteine efflux transporter [Sporomusa malonica]
MMQRRDILIGLVVVTVWGLNFIAIKMGLRDVPPLLLGALRFLLACFPIIFFLPRPPIPWPWLIALGLSINVGQFSCLFLGMKVGMPAGLASLVLQSQAFFTLLVGVTCLGERWQWNHLAGLALSGGGMAMIGLQQGVEMTTAGFGLTLAAAACWGIGNVIMRRATLGIPPFSMLSLVVWAGAVAILPLTFLSWMLEGYDAWLVAFHSPTWTSIGSLVYLSFFATLVGYGLWGKLLSRYPAAVVSPLALLVPIVGMSSSALLLGESVSLWQGIGALLVMTGLVVHVLGARWRMSTAELQKS